MILSIYCVWYIKTLWMFVPECTRAYVSRSYNLTRIHVCSTTRFVLLRVVIVVWVLSFFRWRVSYFFFGVAAFVNGGWCWLGWFFDKLVDNTPFFLQPCQLQLLSFSFLGKLSFWVGIFSYVSLKLFWWRTYRSSSLFLLCFATSLGNIFWHTNLERVVATVCFLLLLPFLLSSFLLLFVSFTPPRIPRHAGRLCELQ